MSAASFEACLNYLLSPAIEGGYVNDPDDPGGETNMGICKRSYPNVDIKNLTRDQAAAIYLRDYWLLAHCDVMPRGVDLMVFDCAVNQGVGTAIGLLQHAAGVTVDGKVGANTLSAAAGKYVLRDLAALRLMRYATGKNFLKYGNGWFRRVLMAHAAALALQGAV